MLYPGPGVQHGVLVGCGVGVCGLRKGVEDTKEFIITMASVLAGLVEKILN